MKLSLSHGPLSPLRARNLALLNQFGTPGLGSLLARRFVPGAGQLSLFVLGFVMIVVWFVDEMQQYYALMFSDNQPRLRNWLVFVGVGLCVCAWLWALVTSFSLVREARRNEQATMKQSASAPSATPPILK